MLAEWLARVGGAISRARVPILLMALTYLLSVAAGIALVTTGNGFSLRYRDKMVHDANASSSAMQSLNSGHRVQAAIFDFAGNLVLGAVPNTVAGVGVVLPFPMAVFRGWIGGIVSVDGNHKSRLTDRGNATYYVVVLVMQLIPYSFAGGAGVALGLRFYTTWGHREIKRWWILPRDATLDVLWIYSAVVPLFFLASLFEFLAV